MLGLSVDQNLLSIGIIEMVITLIMSLAVVVIGFKAFSISTKKINEHNELKNNNIAVGILSASVIISMAILIKSALEPSITTFRLLISNEFSFTSIMLSVVFLLIFFIIAGIISIIVILFSSIVYNKLTKEIDEYSEIKNNNIAVAIVLGAVIISISFIVQDGVTAMISGIQPWPEAIQNQEIPTKIGFILKNKFELVKSFII